MAGRDGLIQPSKEFIQSIRSGESKSSRFIRSIWRVPPLPGTCVMCLSWFPFYSAFHGFPFYSYNQNDVNECIDVICPHIPILSMWQFLYIAFTLFCEWECFLPSHKSREWKSWPIAFSVLAMLGLDLPNWLLIDLGGESLAGISGARAQPPTP